MNPCCKLLTGSQDQLLRTSGLGIQLRIRLDGLQAAANVKPRSRERNLKRLTLTIEVGADVRGLDVEVRRRGVKEMRR